MHDLPEGGSSAAVLLLATERVGWPAAESEAVPPLLH
jgi:hypothetical protein